MKAFLLAAVITMFSFTAFADNAAPYVFSNAILRETPAKIAAGYVTISNPTAKNDTLVGAKADWADKIELHSITTNDQGVMQMTPVKEIALPANDKAELKQGGYHLMIFGVKQNLKVDDKKSITLIFKQAGALPVPFIVQPLGNASQSAQMHDHLMMDHDKMMNMPGM